MLTQGYDVLYQPQSAFSSAGHRPFSCCADGDFPAVYGHRKRRGRVKHADRGLGTSSHRQSVVTDALRSREKHFSWQSNSCLPAWNSFIWSLGVNNPGAGLPWFLASPVTASSTVSDFNSRRVRSELGQPAVSVAPPNGKLSAVGDGPEPRVAAVLPLVSVLQGEVPARRDSADVQRPVRAKTAGAGHLVAGAADVGRVK